ncbi:MAG: hypothetical protein WBA57_08555 [Elainellaceae cyanobacterium]
MKKADWNLYLSVQNPWTSRLIGLEHFSKTRDINQIQREYDTDKYGSLLHLNSVDVEDYKKQEYLQSGLDFQSLIKFSLEEELFEAPVSTVRSIYYALVEEVIRPYQPRQICELGCGYGANFPHLQSLTSDVYGGEFSHNAVEIASRFNLKVSPFNYYHLDDYQLIRENSIVFTSHSVEQLPDAQCFIDGLEKHREKIDLVVNFEPMQLKSRQTLIGALRNRYIELNDYNRNLIELLQNHPNIEVLEFRPDCIGINPLNPACIIVWRFRK